MQVSISYYSSKQRKSVSLLIGYWHDSEENKSYSLVESLISLMKSKEIFLFSIVKDDVNKKRKIIDCLMIME